MKKSEKRKLCTGCRDNFYNGNNPLGVTECWNLRYSRPVKRKMVDIWDRPPWNWQPIVNVLDCYRQKGKVFVAPEKMS